MRCLGGHRTILVTVMAWVFLSVPALSVESLARIDDMSLLGLQPFRGAEPAPDFSLPALNGQTVSVKDYRNKALLLYFWTTF